MKKINKIILAFLLVFGTNMNLFINNVYAIDETAMLDINDGSIEISATGYRQATVLDDTVSEIAHDGNYEITGSTLTNQVSVISGAHDITLNNVSIVNTAGTSCSFSVRNGSSVNLEILNTNKIHSGSLGPNDAGFAGIEVSDGNSIVINGTGKLEVIGGNGGAGIGGSYLENGGNIKILGTSIDATPGKPTTKFRTGGAIGGGCGASGGTIYIGGTANITANGENGGAGIGSGDLYTPSDVLTDQSIVITDDATVFAKSESYLAPGAAIGGGKDSNGGNIEISGNAKVEAIATDTGTAIGGGLMPKLLNETTIVVKDNAYVKAVGAGFTAAFGNGMYSDVGHGKMTIEGQPTIFAYTYGYELGRECVEDDTISSDFTNNSSSVVLKGYFNLTNCLTDSGSDTYLNILTADGINHEIQYSGVSNRYFTDYVLITPLNQFEFKDYKNDPLQQNLFGPKNVAKVTYKNSSSTIKETYAVINNPTIKPDITADSGKAIEGWYTDSSLTNKWDFADNVDTDMELYIKQSSVYTVDFVTNNDTSIDSQEVFDGNKVSKPLDISKNGYELEGWYTDTLLTNKWDFDNDVVSANMTLYAKWLPLTYTITYEGLNGETHTNRSTYTIETDTFNLTDPSSRTDFVFDGWFDDMDNKVTSIVKGKTGNITLTAKWSPEVKHTIAIKQEKQKILRVYKDGVNSISDVNSKVLDLEMTNKGVAINTDYSLLEWEVENIAGFEDLATVCEVDETTGTIIGLKSGIAKVTVKLKDGYDENNPNTYDTVIIIVPGNVDKIGEMTMEDVAIVAKAVSSIETLENQVVCENKEYLEELADIDGDGIIGMTDVSIMARMVTNLEQPSN